MSKKNKQEVQEDEVLTNGAEGTADEDTQEEVSEESSDEVVNETDEQKSVEADKKAAKKEKTKAVVWAKNVKYRGKTYSVGTKTDVQLKDLDELVEAKVIHAEE